mmetsp:Transcript_14453/g.23912  ORF Transcript_14453/g.23912 Transcript_14453/m.23912 type:complete len:371 (-) Transcript_14453:24-1136(-)
MIRVRPTASSESHHVAGVWQRIFEEDPLGSGSFDRETLVHWTQAPCGMYVDIRLPQNSPGRSLKDAAAAGFSPNPLALITDETTAILDDAENAISAELFNVFMKQKSFAGYLLFAFGDTTSGEALAKDGPLAALLAKSNDHGAAIPPCTCFWRREMDYQPPSGGLDIGVCVGGPLKADGTIDMRETGDDASYAEGWRRLSGTKGEGIPFCALELVQENGFARKGFWVRAGNRFAYAIGRPSDEAVTNKLGCAAGSHKIVDNVGKSLAEATTAAGAGRESALQQAWSYVAVIGEVRDNGAAWYIESSTRPDLVGCHLLGGDDASTCCSSLTKDAADHDMMGDHVDQLISGSKCVRKWRVVEVGGFDLPIQA